MGILCCYGTGIHLGADIHTSVVYSVTYKHLHGFKLIYSIETSVRTNSEVSQELIPGLVLWYLVLVCTSHNSTSPVYVLCVLLWGGHHDMAPLCGDGGMVVAGHPHCIFLIC